jgi:hypothetical protein
MGKQLVTMVYLKDMKSQWPWNPNAPEDFADKEIYTHRVSIEDASDVWRVPVLPPMDGFAFVGMRISVYGKDSTYTVTPRLVLGETQRSMFGLPWDHTILSNGSWAPLGFPLTHKMIAIGEDGLDYLVKHVGPCWGKMEFIAQRFEDLREDESNLSYIFLNHRTDKVEWILNEDNRMFKINPIDGPVYRRPSKIIPSMLRLLDTNRNDWDDVSLSRDSVNIPAPLLV